jgi:prepilin-type N-terminal cleavage/methylation domain-containing protein
MQQTILIRKLPLTPNPSPPVGERGEDAKPQAAKPATSRPGVTLLEVLITIFIMGIGMLALLVLFPLGAVNMARALRDDRAKSSAIMAENVAIAQDLRHDPLARPLFTAPYGGIPDANGDMIPDNDLISGPTPWNGPSHPVYVDPYGARLGAGPLGPRLNMVSVPPTPFTPGIPRVSPAFLPANPTAVDRWFSLPDDLGYFDNGLPDNSASFVDRGGDYTWAYLVRRPRASSEEVVDMKVVVYYRRSLDLLEGENVYEVVSGAAGTNSVTLTWPAGQEAPGIRVGRWILDTTLGVSQDPTQPAGAQQRPVVHGEFYRVVNWADLGNNQMVLELQSDLKADVNTVVFMEKVIEVFDRTLGPRP